MKVRTKVTSLMVFVMLILGMGTAAHIHMDRVRVMGLFDAERQEKIKVFEELVRLEGNSLNLLAYDYTYWDEMVDFIASADPAWGKDNLDPGLSTFRADAIWVYGLDGKKVYAVDDRGGELARSFPGSFGSPSELFPGDTRFVHYFTNTPLGLMEVRGATIHTAADIKRKFKPRGYFFTARLLDKDYLDRLEGYMSGTTAVISRLPENIPSLSEELSRGEITFSKALKDWNGAVTGYFVIRSSSSTIEGARRSSRIMLTMLLVFSLAVVLSLMVFLSLWINRPLKMISMALENEDPERISPLLKAWDEFGRVAQLIDNFFHQRKTLVSEIDRRRKVEEELNVKISQLKQFKDIAVGREIRMMELKKEINKLSRELGRPEPYDASF